MTYDSNQWVAFMSPITKASRTGYYRGLNFAGTVDWALDLQDFFDDGLDLDGDPDDLPKPPPNTPPCTGNYATLEELDSAVGSIPDNCKAYYIAQTLLNVLTATMRNYTDMMANGYAGKFKTYAKAVADGADRSVHDYVYKNGNKYFSCIVVETTSCCEVCRNNPHSATYCDYCFDGTCYEECDTTFGCNSKHSIESFRRTGNRSSESGIANHKPDEPVSFLSPILRIKNVSELCPPDYSKRGEGSNDPYEQSVYWNLLDDKSDTFYSDLFDNTGIPKNKTKIGDYTRIASCGPAAKPDDICHALGMDYGIPIPSGFSTADVTDPQKVAAKALDNSKTLADEMASAVRKLRLRCYDGDGFELVDSISLPVLMIAQAVESMEQVETVADKIDEEKRKAIILAFLGAILFFVPIAGEVLGAVTELADVSAILTILGVAGNAALDVYTIVDDPENAPLAIFSLILEPLALADLAKIGKAANIRRGIKEADMAKLGGKVSQRMGTIKKMTGTCCRKA